MSKRKLEQQTFDCKTYIYTNLYGSGSTSFIKYDPWIHGIELGLGSEPNAQGVYLDKINIPIDSLFYLSYMITPPLSRNAKMAFQLEDKIEPINDYMNLMVNYKHSDRDVLLGEQRRSQTRVARNVNLNGYGVNAPSYARDIFKHFGFEWNVPCLLYTSPSPRDS